MGSKLSRRALLVSMTALGIQSCQRPSPSPQSTPNPAEAGVFLYGAGATFPSFLYLKWFQDYNRLFPGVELSYQPIGSAAGIQQYLAGTVDFGASDVALSDEEIAQVKAGALLIPSTAGSIAVVYNLPDISTGLKLSRQVLPAIYLGQITRWNDPQIVALNPDLNLPDLPIDAIYRSDGSGTTAAFTAHLSAINPGWKSQVGSGLNVQWPIGVAIKDNAGVSAQIQQGVGTIGYVEFAFAKQLGLATAALQNQAGQMVLPTTASTASALATVDLGSDLRGFAADPTGSDSYPIVTYSWILAYQQMEDAAQAQALRDVILWGLTEGQKSSESLGYVPLPAGVVEKAKAVAERIGTKR